MLLKYCTTIFTHLHAGRLSLFGALLLKAHLSKLHNGSCHLVYVRSFVLAKAQDVECSLGYENIEITLTGMQYPPLGLQVRLKGGG